AERILARRARAAAPDRLAQARAIHFHAAADAHVVHRHPGVLAQQAVPVLGDLDVGDHGAEHALGAGIGFRACEPVEALLDVGRQQLEGPDVELLGRLLDLLQIYLHSTLIFLSLTTRAQSADSSFIALPISSGVLPTGARPST